eukprot:s275_g28.t1
MLFWGSSWKPILAARSAWSNRAWLRREEECFSYMCMTCCTLVKQVSGRILCHILKKCTQHFSMSFEEQGVSLLKRNTLRTGKRLALVSGSSAQKATQAYEAHCGELRDQMVPCDASLLAEDLTSPLSARKRGTYGIGLALVTRLVALGVTLGVSDLHFVWQAWRLATWTFTLCGRRGTGLTLVTHLVALGAGAVCVAGVALGGLGDMYGIGAGSGDALSQEGADKVGQKKVEEQFAQHCGGRELAAFAKNVRRILVMMGSGPTASSAMVLFGDG